MPLKVVDAFGDLSGKHAVLTGVFPPAAVDDLSTLARRKQLPPIRSVQRLGRPAQRLLSAPHRVSPHVGSRVFLKGSDVFAAMTRRETHADEHRVKDPM